MVKDEDFEIWLRDGREIPAIIMGRRLVALLMDLRVRREKYKEQEDHSRRVVELTDEVAALNIKYAQAEVRILELEAELEEASPKPKPTKPPKK